MKLLPITLNLLCLCMFFLARPFPLAFCTTEDEARTAVNIATTRIVECYMILTETEKTGANISSLLSVLNEAGELLSRSQLALTKEEFDLALNASNACVAKLDGFVEKATSLKQNAEQMRQKDFLVNIVGSFGGGIALWICGLLVWQRLKRRYVHGEKQQNKH